MPSGQNSVKFDFDINKIMSEEGFANEVKPSETPAEPEPPAQTDETDLRKPDTPTEQGPQGPDAENATKETTSPDTPAKPEPPAITDEAVLAFYNQKYDTQYKSLDEFVQVREVEKVVEKDPELPEDVQSFLNYKQETGRSLQDYMKLQRDYSSMSNLDLARDAIRSENAGMELTSAEADLLLADKFGVDTEDLNSLEGKDLLRLRSYANGRLQQLRQDQEKYKLPTESKKAEEKAAQPVGEQVRLSNGQVVSKEVYEAERRKYIDAQKTAVNGLEDAAINLTVDNNGQKEDVSFKYSYTPEDKHSMLSLTEDVSGIMNRYATEDGFNHKSFNEDLWWSVPQNREKAIKAMLIHARSNGIDEVLKEKRNINFTQQQKPTTEQKTPEGYANDRIGSAPNGRFGVKYALPSE